MTTINISLPEKLKTEAEALIKKGFYSSFSDLVRDSLRNAIEKTSLDKLYLEAKEDERTGKAVILKNKKDIEKYMNSIR